jgi:phosphodiesterase/alkaline phosphatase D-like protein
VNVTDTLVPARLAIAGLTAATRYYYRASDAAGATASGTFRTPAAVGAKVGLRLGISGDWRGELSPYPAIANAPARNLDLFVEFGDTIYADYESPALPGVAKAQTIEQYRVKHDEVYSTRALSNTWAALRSSTAVLSTIDDHEVINDFAGGAAPASDPRFAGSAAAYINDTPLYENGLQAFQEYNPVADER